MGQPASMNGGGGGKQQQPPPMQGWRNDRYQVATNQPMPTQSQAVTRGPQSATGGKQQQAPQMGGQSSGKGQQPPQPTPLGGVQMMPGMQQQQSGKGQQPPGMMHPGGKGQQSPQMGGYNNGLTTFNPNGGPQQYGNAGPLPNANMQGGPWGGWRGSPNQWSGNVWMGGQQYGGAAPSNPYGAQVGGNMAPQTGGAQPNPNAPAPSMQPPQGWSNQGLSPQDLAFIRNVSNANPGNQNAALGSLLTKEQINNSMNGYQMSPQEMAQYAANPNNARAIQALQGFGYGNTINDYMRLYGQGGTGGAPTAQDTQQTQQTQQMLNDLMARFNRQ